MKTSTGQRQLALFQVVAFLCFLGALVSAIFLPAFSFSNLQGGEISFTPAEMLLLFIAISRGSPDLLTLGLLLSVVATVFGGLTVLLALVKRANWLLIAGAFGALALVSFAAVTRSPFFMLLTGYRIGFWCYLGALAAAAILNFAGSRVHPDGLTWGFSWRRLP